MNDYTVNDYNDDATELMERASELPMGRSKVSLIEEAVRIADTHQDDDLGYELRMELLEASMFGGRIDLTLMAFPWLLAKSDADPERFDGEPLLWRYKWVIGNVKKFPTVPLDQIELLFEDMKRRHEAAGSTLHAYWEYRRSHAMCSGERDQAIHAHKQIENTKRDFLSNCKACVQEELMDYHKFLGDYNGALAAAKPIFRGRMSCAHVPHRTHALVQELYLRLKKPDEAIKHFKTGYRMVNQNPSFLVHQGMHILGLTLTDNVARAITLLQRHWPESADAETPDNQFEFYLYVRVLLEHVRNKGETKLIKGIQKIMSPKEESHAIEQIIDDLDRATSEIAFAFDQRNGTKEYQRRKLMNLELLDYLQPTPMTCSRE